MTRVTKKMLPTTLLAAASMLVLTLAGCVGGLGIQAGDEVQVELQIMDENGAVRSQGRFLVIRAGLGQSGLGDDFEQALIGKQEGQSFSIQVDGLPQFSFNASQPFIRPSPPQQFPIDDAVPIEAFQPQFGFAPRPGEVFGKQHGFPFFDVRVLSVSDTEVVLRREPHAHPVAYPILGGAVDLQMDGNLLTAEFLPRPGHVFAGDDRAGGFRPNAFYQTIGGGDGSLHYAVFDTTEAAGRLVDAERIAMGLPVQNLSANETADRLRAVSAKVDEVLNLVAGYPERIGTDHVTVHATVVAVRPLAQNPGTPECHGEAATRAYQDEEGNPRQETVGVPTDCTYGVRRSPQLLEPLASATDHDDHAHDHGH